MKLRQMGSADASNVADAERAVVCSGRALPALAVSPVAVAVGAFGTGVVGFSLAVPVTTHGVTVNVNVTQLFVVKGRLGHQVTFTAVGTPFSPGLEQQIMAVAARQL